MMKALNRIPGPLIVWVTSFVFFLITLVNNFSAAHDSINYLDNIVKGEHLFHQHHLLYHFFAYKWLGALEGFLGCGSRSPESIAEGLIFCRQHYLIESFTALWGASLLTLVYLFLRHRFFLTRAACMLGTAVVAFSYGTWFYSTNIEVYMPPAFFILWCLYLLTRKELQAGDIWKIAVLHSAAILFHQVNILFVIVALYVILRAKIYRGLITYALLGIVITGGTYFMVGWFVEGHGNLNDWVGWMQGYTVGHDYWQPLSAKTPIHVITGFGHAFVGGHFVFQLPSVQSYLQSSFQSHGLRDEVFLSTGISPIMAWVLCFLTLILAIILIILALKFVTRFRTMTLHRHVLLPVLVCLFTYSVFFCFWMPEILEFWILQMILVWLLFIGMLPVMHFPFRLRVVPGLLITAALLFSINFFGSMRWLKDINRDWYYVEVQKIIQDQKAGKTPAAIRNDDWIMKDYQRYFIRSY